MSSAHSDSDQQVLKLLEEARRNSNSSTLNFLEAIHLYSQVLEQVPDDTQLYAIASMERAILYTLGHKDSLIKAFIDYSEAEGVFGKLNITIPNSFFFMRALMFQRIALEIENDIPKRESYFRRAVKDIETFVTHCNPDELKQMAHRFDLFDKDILRQLKDKNESVYDQIKIHLKPEKRQDVIKSKDKLTGDYYYLINSKETLLSTQHKINIEIADPPIKKPSSPK